MTVQHESKLALNHMVSKNIIHDDVDDGDSHDDDIKDVDNFLITIRFV